MASTKINYRALEQGYYEPVANNLTSVLIKREEITHQLANLQTLRDTNLHSAQHALLDSTTVLDDQVARQDLEDVESRVNETFHLIRGLVDELKHLADPSDPRVQSQVDTTKNQVQQAIQDYYRSRTEFDRALRGQVWRRYEIANPDASAEEVAQGVHDVLVGKQMIFQVQGARSRQARDAQAAVIERSAAIRKVEQDLINLSELSEQVAELVRCQEPVVEKIEHNAMETAENYENGNEKISQAIVSARNARKYKWYILLVCILIIAIIVAICVGWCKATDHC